MVKENMGKNARIRNRKHLSSFLRFPLLMTVPQDLLEGLLFTVKQFEENPFIKVCV